MTDFNIGDIVRITEEHYELPLTGRLMRIESDVSFEHSEAEIEVIYLIPSTDVDEEYGHHYIGNDLESNIVADPEFLEKV